MTTRTRTCSCGAPLAVAEVAGMLLWASCCPDCAARESHERAEADRVRRLRDVWAASNLPRAAEDWDLDRAGRTAREGFERARYWQYCREGLYLHGRAGTGKTVCAWALLRRNLEDGRSGLYLHVPEFLGELRRRSELGRSWEERARVVQLLVLDDIGAEQPSEWVREALLVVIDGRINRKLPTIYTSNHRPAALFEHLGDPTGRIADRIVGSCRVVEFVGPSFRLEWAKGHTEDRR